jgi:hypothetical protein
MGLRYMLSSRKEREKTKKGFLSNADVRSLLSGIRRRFLKSAGGMAAASTALPLAGRAGLVRSKIYLPTEGVVGLNAVVPQPNRSSLLSAIVQQILSGAFQIRQRMTFSVDEDEDDVLSVQVFILPSDAPFPLPAPPPVPPEDDDPASISLFQVEVARILLCDKPAPNLALLGTVTAAPVPSPFGNIVGLVAALGAGYDQPGDEVNFTMLGGFVAGSHSTWSLTGVGSLVVGQH